MEENASAITVSNQPLLERLYEAHVPRNIRIAYLLTGNLETAKDIVHESFIRVSMRLHTLRNADAFGAYMTRTVVNMSKRHRERRSIEQRYAEKEERAKHPYSFQPDVEARHEVLAALRALPHRQRAVLVLRYYADMAEADIADALDCPIGTVKSLASRGLDALKDRIGEGT